MNRNKWTMSKSGKIWFYGSSEFPRRGIVVEERNREYHAWGESDSW